jgi:hypothetical protein
MKVTSADCKSWIVENVSPESKASDWKRRNKRKDGGNSIIRIFWNDVVGEGVEVVERYGEIIGGGEIEGLNPPTTEAKASDWAFWTTVGENGRHYLAFAPLNGNFREPNYPEGDLIREAMKGHSEIVEWVYEDNKDGFDTDNLEKRGFVADSKASHLLDYMREIGSFLPDEDGDEDIGIDAVWKESREIHAKNPDALLGFKCQKCGTTTPGKMRCVKTGCCETCSDNYEPYVPKELW